MGRRVRHLNPAHCGATHAYDSRFISGLANGAQVATWANRGNAALNLSRFGTAASLTYQANAQGGQPCVNISAANALLSTASVNLVTTYGFSTTATLVSACKNSRADGTDRRLFRWGNTTGSITFELWCQYQDNNMYLDLGNVSAGGRISGAVPNNTSAVIMSAVFGLGSGGSTVRRSGTQVLSGSMASSLGSFTGNFCLGGDDAVPLYEWVGDFYSFALGPFTNEAIRRRLEQSAAFSFKIANG